MPAPLTPLRDDSSLGSDRVNVASRVAWLLRMARLTAGGGHSQAAVGTALRATGVRTHARLMSEVENGKVRHGRIIDGYERALGLREGQLRAPVDVLCRALPGGPPDRDDASRAIGGGHLGVEEISERGERVRHPRRSGGAWLSWARAITAPEARGFPTWVAAPWLDELVDELGRSVGTAYVTRYEALSLLRTSPYGHLVLEAARRAVADPHAQVLVDTVSATADRPTPEVLRWAAELLADHRPMAVRAASHALLDVAATGGGEPEHWDLLVDPLVAAYERAVARADAGWHHTLSGVVTSLPERQAQAVTARLSRPPAPAASRVALGERTQADRRWRTATELAERVAEPDNLPDRPLLARLLFEVIHDQRPRHHFTATMLLVAVPFAHRVVEVLHDHAVREASDRDRHTILFRLAQMAPSPGLGTMPALAAGDVADLSARAVLLAHGGQRVEREVLDVLMARGHRRRALYAAGMTQDPWLDKVAHADEYPDEVRGAARWWQERDGLVDDLPGPR